MNGQFKLKKRLGLVSLITGISGETYQTAATLNEKITGPNLALTLVYASLITIGAYAVGHYNGWKKAEDRMQSRYDKGLRYTRRTK